MRLSPEQASQIRTAAQALAGDTARLWLFGSRLHDDLRGGDVDFLLEVQEPVARPALLAAQLSARATRLLHGRRVDVIIKAPNLLFTPVHERALREGILL